MKRVRRARPVSTYGGHTSRQIRRGVGTLVRAARPIPFPSPTGEAEPLPEFVDLHCYDADGNLLWSQFVFDNVPDQGDYGIDDDLSGFNPPVLRITEHNLALSPEGNIWYQGGGWNGGGSVVEIDPNGRYTGRVITDPDASDPGTNDMTAVGVLSDGTVIVGFRGAVKAVEPGQTYLSDTVSNGGFESGFANWTLIEQGESTVNQDATEVKVGSTSARIDLDDLNSKAGLTSDVALDPGKTYDLGFWAKTDHVPQDVGDPAAFIVVEITDDSGVLLSRNVSFPGGTAATQWNRFQSPGSFLEFEVPADATNPRLTIRNGRAEDVFGGEAPTDYSLWLDGVTLTSDQKALWGHADDPDPEPVGDVLDLIVDQADRIYTAARLSLLTRLNSSGDQLNDVVFVVGPDDDDHCAAIAVDSAGNWIAGGQMGEFSDWRVAKISPPPSGSNRVELARWVKLFDEIQDVFDVVVDGDDNVIVGIGDDFSRHPEPEVGIYKYDPGGVELWRWTDRDIVYELALDEDNNIYAAAGGLFKIGPDGETIWSRDLGRNTPFGTAGIGQSANALAVDNERGRVYVAGGPVRR